MNSHRYVIVPCQRGFVVKDDGNPDSSRYRGVRYADANGMWYSGYSGLPDAGRTPFTSKQQAEIFIMRQGH